MMKARFALPAALLTIGIAAYAQDAVTLTRKFKEGDVIRFKTVVNATVMGGEAVVTSTAKQTVKKVKDNGEITVSIVDEGGKLSFGGMEQDLPAGAEVVETRDKAGKLSKIEFPNGGQEFMTPEVRHLTSLLAEPMLSDKPVKAGDTWTVEVDNPAVKGKKVTFKGTFAGSEKLADSETWKLKQTAEAISDDKGAKIAAETTYWLDPATGQTIKSESAVKGIPTQFGEMSWTAKSERVKPEEKKAQ